MAAKKGEPHGQVNPKTGLVPRQELFAQYIAAGHTLEKAMQDAGYHITTDGLTRTEAHQRWGSAGNKLRKKPKIKARIEQLMAEQAAVIEVQRNKLSDKFQMNLEKLTLMLMEDRHFARTGELSLPDQPQIKDHTKGPDWRSDARAAVQATMGLAKLHGLLIDKAEITVQGSISRMSNEELLQFIQKVHSEIGPVLEVGADVEQNPQVEYTPPAKSLIRKG
jgi:hypothetical protein